MEYRQLAEILYRLLCKQVIGSRFCLTFTGEGSLVQKLGTSGFEGIDGATMIDWNTLQSQSTCITQFIRSGRSYDVVLDKKSLHHFVTRTFTIFYSWQSWLPVATNKDLIRSALETAADSVNQREQIRFVVDSDFAGVAGAPSFAAAILQKIANADIFIADVSAVGSEYSSEKKSNRPIPNANVMFEYGYASAKLSAERMILVHNNSYARVEELPSDIRQNKVLTYTCLAQDVQAVDDAQKELSEQFVKELTIIAKHLLAE